MPKVWYVAIVGRPNAGKSTLINALIGEKVSAISPRPQTTQRSIPGIFTDEEKEIQIVFLDTPWIHHDGSEQFGSQKAQSINTRINSEAFASLREADVIVRLVDPTRPSGAEDDRIDEVLAFSKVPVLRVETKQDLTKSYLGKNIDLKIDSINRLGFEEFISAIAEKLPEWPFLYEADQYTDQTMELRITEVIREQLFATLGEEIPYACYVEIGSIENGIDAPIINDLEWFAPKNVKGKLPMLSVQAYINTETDSQKTIVIGKQGKKIQDIGTASRLILEEIFGKKVFLALRVKVDKNWRKNEKTLNRLFPKR
jgi:GTP-binding protein Era